MEETMERTGMIIRRSIYTLLKDFHFFINSPVVLLLPFSASVLLYQSCFYSDRHLLHPNLFQLISSYVFNLPFALSSLIIAKASVIQHLRHDNHTVLSLYKPLVLTYLCNIILSITINIATLFILRVASNFIEGLSWFSSKNPVFLMAALAVYYIVLTNTMIICNLGVIMAGMNKGMGCKAIYGAYLLRKGTNPMALWLAFPINLGLAAVQFLFQYRIVRAHDRLHGSLRSIVYVVVEGLLITYMFSVLTVLDTIASCLFIKACESDLEREQKGEICYIQIDEFVKEDNGNSCRLQDVDEVP